MKTKSSDTTIGIDLGDRKHAICVLDKAGEILSETTIPNDREELAKLSKKYPKALVAIEVGMHSPWISRLLQDLGHRVLVANPRKLRAIYLNDRKSDRTDAVILARIARADENLLYPVKHGSEQAQRDLLQIKLRDTLVRQRVNIISSVRFTLKSLGIRTSSPKTSCFARRLRRELGGHHDDMLELVGPSLVVLDSITAQIRELDKAIRELAATSYPETEYLSQITGIGPITSLAFVLTIEDPERFKRPRDIGAYLGLVPKRDQSGDSDKQMRVSRAGNSYLRKLLISAAQYVLGPFGPDSDLKRHGQKLAERGGPRAKKKAVVAIARKLAVLLLTLWKNEDIYEAGRLAA